MNAVVDTSALRHIIVVGGTVAEWAALSPEQWNQHVGELGKVADSIGASWLTLRPYDGVGGDTSLERLATIGHCLVSAHPQADGRQRVASAAAALQAEGKPITEAAIARQLNAPAEADPDLVVVLGSSHRLPPSLVWELAYSELVFLDLPFAELSAAHLEDAINSYARRNRRFGGVND